MGMILCLIYIAFLDMLIVDDSTVMLGQTARRVFVEGLYESSPIHHQQSNDWKRQKIRGIG